MPFFDEIVAVYNQCTDATPEILLRLQTEFGPSRLRVIHYLDQVHPPGSEGHAQTDPSSPNSLVNYYNFSLISTRYKYATKLDDDHLAITETTQRVTDGLRNGTASPNTMFCFSGLNLFPGTDGNLGILDSDPISGGGDIGFFPVTNQTYFVHDRRFERFRRGSLRREFAGYLYWHLKYLKRDMGFGNYALPVSRRNCWVSFLKSQRWLPVEMRQSRRHFQMAVCEKRSSARLNANLMPTSSEPTSSDKDGSDEVIPDQPRPIYGETRVLYPAG
jgi:hypothetical protein